jgi:hypothetical protein
MVDMVPGGTAGAGAPAAFSKWRSVRVSLCNLKTISRCRSAADSANCHMANNQKS